MRKPPYPYRRVEVIWDDAASNTAAWVDKADLAQPERVNTSGWLVHDVLSHIVIASSIDADGDPDSSVGAVITIPRGMILTIKDLQLVKQRNVRSRLHSEPNPEEVHREPSES